MNNVVHEGIILRNYIPKKQKLSILDSNLGRIECISLNSKNNHRLFSGAFINYTLKKFNMYYVVENTNIIDFPQDLIDHNFAFFHHVLELCYYFLPLDQEASDIFELINLCYLKSNLTSNKLAKNIFLCKFFSILGIYPSDYLANNSEFYKFISGPINIDLDFQENKNFNIFAKRWLLECVNSHPNIERLKTVGFLKDLDLHV